MTYYIYKFTNKENLKSYIGCTRNIGSRIQQHIKGSMKESKLLHADIQRYGIEKFTIEILMTTNYADDAFHLEQVFIERYHSFTPNGYNHTTGGAGNPGYTGKRVVRLDLDGNYVCSYSCVNSTERDGFHPRVVMKCCKGEALTSKGFQFMFEDDYNEHGGHPYVRPQSACIKSIVQCDEEGNLIREFESVKEASEITETSRTAISGCLNGYYKRANGFIWVYKENFPINDLGAFKQGKKGTKVLQLDKDTEEVIAEYDNMADAARAVGGDHRNIQKIVNLPPNRTAYGFKWRKVSQ